MLDFESFPIATLLLTDPEYFPAILEYAKEDKPIKWDSWLLFYFEADAILHDLRSFDCNFNLDNEPKLRKKFDRFLSSFSTSFPHKNQIGNGVNASPFSRTIFDAICRLHDLRIPLVAALAPLVAIIASEIVIKCTKWVDNSRLFVESLRVNDKDHQGGHLPKSNLDFDLNIIVGQANISETNYSNRGLVNDLIDPNKASANCSWIKVRQFIVKDIKLELFSVMKDADLRLYFQHYLLHRNDTLENSRGKPPDWIIAPNLPPSRRDASRLFGYCDMDLPGENRFTLIGVADVASVCCWLEVRRILDGLGDHEGISSVIPNISKSNPHPPQQSAASTDVTTATTIQEGFKASFSTDSIESSFAVYRILLQAIRDYHKYYCNIAIPRSTNEIIDTHNKSSSSKRGINSDNCDIKQLLSSRRSTSNEGSKKANGVQDPFAIPSSISNIEQKSVSLKASLPQSRVQMQRNTRSNTNDHLSTVNLVNLSCTRQKIERLQTYYMQHGVLANGISEHCRLDIASIVNYSASIRLNCEAVESLDQAFLFLQNSKIIKLLRILERDLFHYLQMSFGVFVEESFEFAQLAAFIKTKDSTRTKNKRQLGEFFEKKVLCAKRGLVPWTDQSAARTTFLVLEDPFKLSRISDSTDNKMRQETLGDIYNKNSCMYTKHVDPKNDAQRLSHFTTTLVAEECKSDGIAAALNEVDRKGSLLTKSTTANTDRWLQHLYEQSSPSTTVCADFNYFEVVEEVTLPLLMQILMLLITSRSVILLHRNENLLAKIKHLVPVLIQPFQLSGLNSCSADDCDVAHSEKLVSCGGTFSTAASLAAWIGKQSTYSSSLVSRSWFITALSQCFFDENKHNTSAAVGESKSSLSSSSAAAASLEEAEFSNTDFQTRLLESDSVVIDLDACRVVSRRASVVMDSFMFRRWNSCDAYRKLHHAVHKQLPKSQTLQDRNQHLEQLVRSFWNETFLRLLPSNLLYFPSHRILACDVQRLLMTLYIDKSRGSQALSASLRQLGIKEQHGHINATSSHFYVHGKKEELINDIRNKVSAMGDKRNSNQHSSNNNYNNFSIHPKCNNGNNSGLLFDDPETWFCCELVGSTLPAFTDLLMRHGRMIESFQF